MGFAIDSHREKAAQLFIAEIENNCGIIITRDYVAVKMNRLDSSTCINFRIYILKEKCKLEKNARNSIL